MRTEELLEQARLIQRDLEALRRDLEASRYRPEEKSRMARDVVESQERVDAVIEWATAHPAEVFTPAV